MMRTLVDELHALAAGTLSSEEEARLRERCAADPELQALLEGCLEAYALTAPADVEPPRCRTTFEELEGACVPQRAWRMVLRRPLRVAAAVLVLVAGVYVVGRVMSGSPDGGEAGREKLVLAAIPLREMPEIEAGPEVPELLASYRPVEEGAIHWVESFDTARAMARVTSRPVLLFIHHPTCPWCIKLQHETFSHDDVLARMDDFVPARVSVMDEAEFTKPLAKLLKEGWPWVGAVDADGGTILSFPGVRGGGDFATNMREASGMAGPPAISWKRVNELAQRYLLAREEEGEGSPGRAHEAYAVIAAEDAGAIGTAAEHGRDRIEGEARAGLLNVRDLAERNGDVPAAAEALRREIRRFDGSAMADDFRAVLESLMRSHRFPTLAE